MPDDPDPGERVLLLCAPRQDCFDAWISVARRLAATLDSAAGGLIVGLADNDDAVRQARRVFAASTNTMFVCAPATEIPWQDGFFNRVIDQSPPGARPNPGRVASEIARVLAPGGVLDCQAD
jgi:ubiquinone/menaquinone biosynthesis C-methylase UbiE